MKKILAFTLSLIMLMGLLVSCGGASQDKPMAFFGYSPMVVQTPSMSPLFEAGDLIFINQNVSPEDIKVGDVICFFDPSQSNGITLTHRVIDFDENGRAITAGDNNVRRYYEMELHGVEDESDRAEIEARKNEYIDANLDDYTYIVYGNRERKNYEGADNIHVELTEEDLVGIYTYKKIPKLGNLFVLLPF